MARITPVTDEEMAEFCEMASRIAGDEMNLEQRLQHDIRKPLAELPDLVGTVNAAAERLLSINRMLITRLKLEALERETEATIRARMAEPAE